MKNKKHINIKQKQNQRNTPTKHIKNIKKTNES